MIRLFVMIFKFLKNFRTRIFSSSDSESTDLTRISHWLWAPEVLSARERFSVSDFIGTPP